MLSDKEVCENVSKMKDVVFWASSFHKIKKVIFHISCSSPSHIERCIDIHKLSRKAHVCVLTSEKESYYGRGRLEVLIVIGKSGREEISDAIAKIAEENINPDTICEETLESHLAYQVHPDFVIKTGGSHLTDFLIWQSVYSELFFSDVNWGVFRRVDFLRALRDYQSRVRRFGR
ncbi:MAG TPA: undecaprenyl diphosphate synthase family protein [Methanocorpusculum sp.]|nr:undecaprenyl diphosphate synthase family protein [Methanocorpusculum sp.]